MFWIPANKFCVYIHYVEGVCIYVGMGSADRPFTKIKRPKRWFELTEYGFNVEIVSWHLSKKAAREEETRLIKQLKPECNSLHTGKPGRKFTDKEKKILSEKWKLQWKNNPNMRAGRVKASLPIKCIETGIIYNSLRDASKKTGFCPSHLSLVVNGHVPHAGGMHFTKLEK